MYTSLQQALKAFSLWSTKKFSWIKYWIFTDASCFGSACGVHISKTSDRRFHAMSVKKRLNSYWSFWVSNQNDIIISYICLCSFVYFFHTFTIKWGSGFNFENNWRYHRLVIMKGSGKRWTWNCDKLNQVEEDGTLNTKPEIKNQAAAVQKASFGQRYYGSRRNGYKLVWCPRQTQKGSNLVVHLV